ISACGSRLSSNRRIEPAVAVKASERPGRSRVCFVVESGGKRCGSAAGGAPGALAPRLVGGADGASSARAPTAVQAPMNAMTRLMRSERAATSNMDRFSSFLQLPVFWAGILGGNCDSLTLSATDPCDYKGFLLANTDHQCGIMGWWSW